MNDSSHSGLDILSSTHNKHIRLGNWKINLIIGILIFVIIGLMGLLGSMNQLYKKLNHVESFCALVIENKPGPILREEKSLRK